jgi:hypothetical protein
MGAIRELRMASRKRHDRDADQAWEIDGVSDTAIEAAKTAAAATGATLETWLADTVLRACQEGVEALAAESFIATGRRPLP